MTEWRLRITEVHHADDAFYGLGLTDPFATEADARRALDAYPTTPCRDSDARCYLVELEGDEDLIEERHVASDLVRRLLGEPIWRARARARRQLAAELRRWERVHA